jgi:hypothetical protein
MGHNDFNKDLHREKTICTPVVVNFLEKMGFELLNKNDDNQYDIKVKHILTNKVVKIEIKEDLACEIYGNIAVEFSCRGNPSGIETTNSDFYFEVVHWDEHTIKYIMIDTNELIKFIDESKKTNKYRMKVGGDLGSNTKFYCVHKEDFAKVGTVVNTITHKKVSDENKAVKEC